MLQEKNARSVSLPDKTFNDVMELMHVLHPPNKDISGKISWYTVSSVLCTFAFDIML